MPSLILNPKLIRVVVVAYFHIPHAHKMMYSFLCGYVPHFFVLLQYIYVLLVPIQLMSGPVNISHVYTIVFTIQSKPIKPPNQPIKPSNQAFV